MFSKALMLVMALTAAMTMGTPTFPRCAEGGKNCCDFGEDSMRNRGYAVLRINETDITVTCSKGDLTCFESNSEIQGGLESKEVIECPEFFKEMETEDIIDGINRANQQ